MTPEHQHDSRNDDAPASSGAASRAPATGGSPPGPPFPVDRWRRETAAVAAGRIHLNNAGASLMPVRVHQAVIDHLARETMHGGYEAADEAAAAIAQVYDDVGTLIGAAGRNIAVVENATVAFAQALSAIDFRSGDTLVTTRNDYVSNQLMYLSLAERLGVNVVRADDLAEGGVDPDSLRACVERHRPKLVAVTHVPTNSGLVQPVHEVGRICAGFDVPFLLDACQSVGQIALDVRELRCTFLAATARKFLRGPRGVGFLYVADDALARDMHPLFLDMQGANWVAADRYELVADAKRFENWEFAYALVLGLGEAARYALDVGVGEGGRHAANLAAGLRARLRDVPGLRVLDYGRELCAIVTVAVEGRDAGDVVRELREEAINTSALTRSSAVLDMDDKGAATAVRISPHYFNTEPEIGMVAGALEGMVGRM